MLRAGLFVYDIVFSIFKNIYLFIWKRERVGGGEGGRETLKQITLSKELRWAASPDPEIMT